MRILKYNLNLAFNTLKYIMAYGVSALKVVPRGQAKPVKAHEQEQKSQGVPECSPSREVIVENGTAVIESEQCDDCVYYTSEVEVPTSPAPEVEYEIEVESTDNAFCCATTPKSMRRSNYSLSSYHKISTINRRSRLWAKQMRRRRRRMSFFDCVQRYRIRYPLPKRWRRAPIPARVDVNILKLLQNKRKQLKRDGLYQFVLWREALKAERNRLLGPRSVFG